MIRKGSFEVKWSLAVLTNDRIIIMTVHLSAVTAAVASS